RPLRAAGHARPQLRDRGERPHPAPAGQARGLGARRFLRRAAPALPAHRGARGQGSPARAGAGVGRGPRGRGAAGRRAAPGAADRDRAIPAAARDPALGERTVRFWLATAALVATIAGLGGVTWQVARTVSAPPDPLERKIA